MMENKKETMALCLVKYDEEQIEQEGRTLEGEFGWLEESGIYLRDNIDLPDGVTTLEDAARYVTADKKPTPTVLMKYGSMTVLDRHTEFEPFVSASGYNAADGTWANGNYFPDLWEACEHAKTNGLAEYISHNRMETILSSVISEINDPSCPDEFRRLVADKFNEDELTFFGLEDEPAVER